MRTRLGFANSLDGMADALAAMEAACAGWGLPPALALRAQLLLEELAGNAIRHGYRDGRVGTLALRLAWRPPLLRCALCDDADPFDPRAPAPPRQADSPGGHGLAILRGLAEGLAHRRTRGRNVTRFAVRQRPGDR